MLEPPRTALELGQLDRRREERPKARREHHAGRKSEHGVEHSGGELPSQEYGCRTHGRDAPRESAAEERLYDRIQPTQPTQHCIHGSLPSPDPVLRAPAPGMWYPGCIPWGWANVRDTGRSDR